MKQSFLTFTVLLAVIFAFSCNTPVVPNAANANSARTAAVVTQKVILLYGNYSLVNNNQDIKLTDGNNSLLLPVSSLLDGKAIFGNASTNKFQGSLLFKDQGTTYTQISNFLKLATGRYSSNKLDPSGSNAASPPKTPPPCGIGACPGISLYQMHTMEVLIATPMAIEATVQ